MPAVNWNCLRGRYLGRCQRKKLGSWWFADWLICSSWILRSQDALLTCVNIIFSVIRSILQPQCTEDGLHQPESKPCFPWGSILGLFICYVHLNWEAETVSCFPLFQKGCNQYIFMNWVINENEEPTVASALFIGSFSAALTRYSMLSHSLMGNNTFKKWKPKCRKPYKWSTMY